MAKKIPLKLPMYPVILDTSTLYGGVVTTSLLEAGSHKSKLNLHYKSKYLEFDKVVFVHSGDDINPQDAVGYLLLELQDAIILAHAETYGAGSASGWSREALHIVQGKVGDSSAKFH